MSRKLFRLDGTSYSRRLRAGLVCALLSLVLAACDDDDDIGPATPEVIITPSATEGDAPLNVTFNVSGAGTSVTSAVWDFGDGGSAQSVGKASVSHTFEQPGANVVTVTVTTSRPTIAVYEIAMIINVLGDDTPPGGGGGPVRDVNLVVASFAIDDQLTPGGYETVSAIVQNIGLDELQGSGLINVGYYLSTDDTITVDDILIGDTSIAIGDFFQAEDIAFGIESLAAGENYQFDHPLAVTSNVPAGVYYAGAIVDYLDYYEWYTFPRSTDTEEFEFPVHVTVAETDETDNARVLMAHQVTVAGPGCADDAFEPDNSSGSANVIAPGDVQARNFCSDNADWLQFDAVQGSVYKITAQVTGAEADTQLMLYDRDASSLLLYNDNILNGPFITPCGFVYTADLECGWPPNPSSEIVWEALASGTYFIRLRLANCDEDKDPHCALSPDGAGLDTEYSISLQ